jgi:hypothetical protein
VYIIFYKYVVNSFCDVGRIILGEVVYNVWDTSTFLIREEDI